VALGLALRGVASSAIDLSDGLCGDLGHILKASGAGATLNTEDASKLIADFSCYTRARSTKSSQRQALDPLQYLLAGGDDYELAFTAPPTARAAVLHAAQQSHTPVIRIGRIDAEPGLRLMDGHGAPVHLAGASFDHFRS
jgi:thiamine-monophosphate kinase